MSKAYDPRDWYWRVAGDDSQVWSSTNMSYVSEDNNAFAVWLADGSVPTDIDSEASLADVLAPYGIRSGDLPTPVARGAEVSAMANLVITGEDISGVDTAVGVGAAMALDVNVYWVFFAETQEDTNYIPFVQAPGYDADVTYPLAPDFMEITVTDRTTGDAATPDRLVILSQRVR